MTTETIDAGSSSFTPAEEAYFASGGESEIPVDNGGAADDAGSAAPAEAAEAPAAEVAAKATNDHVPLARFLDEKKARKAMETQLAELRGKFSVIEKLNAPAPSADSAAVAKAPTAAEDIFMAVDKQGETMAQLQKRLDDADAATKATNERNQFVSDYQADVATFTKTTPDFMAAYNFVLQSRASELMAIGYQDPADPTLTPDEKQVAARALHDAIVADEQGIAQMSLKSKKSPAQVLYALAKQRGYKPAEAAAADTGKGAETLERIEQGQQTNKSLAPLGGASGEAGMTAERLIAMPMEEFETWCAKNPTAAKRIMGG